MAIWHCRRLRTCVNFSEALFRLKRRRILLTQETDILRCASPFKNIHLCGLSSTLVIGIYVISGQVCADIGPATIISLLVSAFASLLSGFCAAELESRGPKCVKSAYENSYYSIGELVAFIVGWSITLQTIMAAAACARTISDALDYLLGYQIYAFLIEMIGKIFYYVYPDFLACFITITISFILATGLQQTFIIYLIVGILSGSIIVFTFCAGIAHINFKNWINHGPIDGSHYGLVIIGASLCFSGFADNQTCCQALDFSPTQPNFRKKSLLILATFASLWGCYFGITTAITLLSPIEKLSAPATSLKVFDLLNLQWAMYICFILMIPTLILALCGSLSSLMRVLYSMARDGLLLSWFAEYNRQTKVPSKCAVFLGVFTGVIAILFELRDLLELLSIGCLMIATIGSVTILLLRYQPSNVTQYDIIPQEIKSTRKHKKKTYKNYQAMHSRELVSDDSSLDEISQKTIIDGNFYNAVDSNSESDEVVEGYESESSDTDIDAIVEEYKIKLRMAALVESSSMANSPTIVTARRVTLALSASIFIFILISAMLVLEFHTAKTVHAWSIAFIVSLIAFSGFLMLVISKQPYNIITLDDLDFQVPFLPWIPLIAIFLNIYLMASLSVVTWIKFLVWMFLGLFNYFFYGINHSLLGNVFRQFPDEEQILLQPIPKQELLHTLIPSHKRHRRSKQMSRNSSMTLYNEYS